MMIKLQIELHPQKFQMKQENHDCKIPKDLAAASTFQGSSALGTISRLAHTFGPQIPPHTCWGSWCDWISRRNVGMKRLNLYIDNLYVYDVLLIFHTLSIKRVFNLQIQKRLVSDENKGYKRNSTHAMDQEGKKTTHDLGCCNAAKVSFSQAQTGYCKFVVT